ncbi:caspase family protein [Nocardia xishanensis]
MPDPSSSYALLIGASTYRSLTDLPAVRNNLEALAGVLTDPALGGLRPDHCIVVHDPVEVRTVYRTLLHYAQRPADTLLVYFAGHGRTDLRNNLYLALADTAPEELRVSGLPFDLVRELLTDSRATNKVLILDCCFSGHAIPAMGGAEDAIVGQLGIEGTYTLTATPATAVALAPIGATYTAFTGELLTLLRTGVPDGPQLLTFAVLYRQLLDALITRGMPRPGQRGTGTIDQLALTRNPAHPANAAPEPTTDRTRIPHTDNVLHEDGEKRFPVKKGIAGPIVPAVIGDVAVAIVMSRAAPGDLSVTWMVIAPTIMGLATLLSLVGAISLSLKTFELQIGPRGMELEFAGRRTRYTWEEISRVTIRHMRGKVAPGIMVFPLPGTPLPHGGIGLWSAHLPRMERKTGWILFLPIQLLKAPRADVERALTRYSAGRFRS